MAGQRHPHGRGVLPPARRAAFDIREQERHRPRAEHFPLAERAPVSL
jgi:hypothetical protein